MEQRYDCLIVGAGMAGAVAARELAEQGGQKVLVLERRNHVGGNMYDRFDERGVLIHQYGPHIFHTNSKRVFDYLSRFTKWRLYEHQVVANIPDGEGRLMAYRRGDILVAIAPAAGLRLKMDGAYAFLFTYGACGLESGWLTFDGPGVAVLERVRQGS